jgi:hypothetical protein
VRPILLELLCQPSCSSIVTVLRRSGVISSDPPNRGE